MAGTLPLSYRKGVPQPHNCTHIVAGHCVHPISSKTKAHQHRFCEPSAMGWDPFDHSEGQCSPNVKKVRKRSRNGLSGPPGSGGQKSQKRVKNELKSLEKVSFELVLNSFLTFLPPETGRPREPISRPFFGLFTFGLSCPSEWSKGSQAMGTSLGFQKSRIRGALITKKYRLSEFIAEIIRK